MSTYPGFTFTNIGDTVKSIIDGSPTLSVLIIGSAQDGPVDTPTYVRDSQDCRQKFGPASYSSGYLDPTSGTANGEPAGATIPLEVAKAFAGGAQNVYVCRVGSGSKATATLGTGSLLNLKARNMGRIYNGIVSTYSLAGDTYTFSIAQPLAKGGTISLTGSSSGTTLLKLLNQINGSNANETVDVSDTLTGVQSSLGLPLSSLASTLTGSATLTGGTNGTFARGDKHGPENFTSAGSGLFGYATQLITDDTGTFDSILNLRLGFDLIWLSGIKVDDQVTNTPVVNLTTSIAVDFSDFLASMHATVAPCQGFIGTRLAFYRETSEQINYIRNNLLATTGAYWDQNSKWICAGPILALGNVNQGAFNTLEDRFHRLCVVAGPTVVYNHQDMGGDYTTDFGAGLVGYLSTIPPESSCVQKSIPGIKGYGAPYPYSFAKKLLDGVGYSNNDDATGKGAYISLVRGQSVNNGPLVINDDVTAAVRNNYFKNFREVNLLNSMHRDIKAGLEVHLGQTAGAERIALMESTVLNILEGYNASGALAGGRGTGFDFKVSIDGSNTSSATVRFEVVPARTLRKINQVAVVRSQI